MQLTSPKVHLSQTIHDWHRPLRIVPYRAIIYASFSKRTPMTVYVSNKQVNNTLIAYIYQRVYTRLPRRYLFVGQVNRHWGAFATRCINNRTIRHDAKGAVPIVYCLRKMLLWGSKLHSCYSISLRFYLGWSVFGDDVKNSCPALLYYMTEGWRLLRWGLGLVPAITYHCNAVPVIKQRIIIQGMRKPSINNRCHRKWYHVISSGRSWRHQPVTGMRLFCRGHMHCIEGSCFIHPK